jgi:hypothetical protein
MPRINGLGLTAALIAGALCLFIAPAWAAPSTSIVRGFAIGSLVLILAAPTVLGIAIGLLGNPRERWMRGAVRGGATGLGSMLMVLLVLGVLIHAS